MTSWRRIEAIAQRHIVLQFRDFYRLFDIIFWPVIDIMLWGFAALWLQSDSYNGDGLLVVLLGLVLWQIVYRSSLELAMNMLQELWDRNLAHLFSTPLTLNEWITATILLSIIRVIMYIGVYCFIIWLLYSINVAPLLLPLLPHCFLLLLSGWSIGFFCCALLMYSGQKAQAFVLPITSILMPFSGVLYALDVVPQWMQTISKILPTAYLFESMRIFLHTGIIEQGPLLISFVLNIVYLIASFLLLITMFNKSKQYGFARLE